MLLKAILLVEEKHLTGIIFGHLETNCTNPHSEKITISKL